MFKNNTKLKLGGLIAVVIAIIAAITGAAININIENGKLNANITYSAEGVMPIVTDEQDINAIETGMGEITVDGKVVNLAATENEGTDPRVAHVAIVIVKHTINLTVTQEPESGDLSNAKASFLGNKALIYNNETWSYTTFGQYKLEFDSE